MSTNGYIRLSELLNLVDDALRTALGEKTWWILAEIKERNERGEYIYFELAEKSGAGEDIIARIRASVWRREAIAAFRNFEDITGKRADKGMQVLVRAGVTFHPTHGLSLQLFDIDSQHMLGQLELHRRHTIAQLAAQKGIRLEDGKFDTPNKREDLPEVIQNIAVITSASAAGYQDFVHALTNNPFGYRFAIQTYFSILQGEKAAESMRDQLISIYNDIQNGSKVDVVVLIRGGGAQSDLLPFDQFRLALALARFPIPVIAGIGHLKNESVADLVVHTSVKTPTQAAEYIIDHNRTFEEEVEALREMIILRTQHLIALLHRKLDHAGTKINSGAVDLIHLRSNHLERVKENLRSVATKRITSAGNKLSEQRLLMSGYTDRLLYKQNHAMERLEEKFRLLDPTVLLKRGYAMVMKNNALISSTEKLNIGDQVSIVFEDGAANATITETKKTENE